MAKNKVVEYIQKTWMVEMIEEKAKEIANERCKEQMCWGRCNIHKNHHCGYWHYNYECALKGIEYGLAEGRKESEKENEQLKCDLYNTNANLQHITIEYEEENAELSNSVTELTNTKTELENKVTELEKDKEWLDNTNNEQTEVILKLNEQIEKKKYFVKIKLEEGCYYRDSGFILELSYEELNIELIYQKVQEKLREIGALDLKIVELIDMKSL